MEECPLGLPCPQQCTFKCTLSLDDGNICPGGDRKTLSFWGQTQLNRARVDFILTFLCLNLERKRSQISDSHANKINRHVNEMCSGHGSVYIGRQSTETYNSMFWFPPTHPSFVPFNPKELFLKARGPGFDHNVRAEGEMALTFLSRSCTISKLQTAGLHVWASITPILWALWGLLFPPRGQTF